jgi:hypothetical protein
MKATGPVYPDAPFPVERLVVAHGELSASAHKNPYNPLHLDWDFYIKFKPLVVGDSTYETAIHVEIETKGIWRLDGFAGKASQSSTSTLHLCLKDTVRKHGINS